MLIFWDQRLVFLATPKTGSTAVESALESLASVAMQRPAPLKHMPARDYCTHIAPLLAARGSGPFCTVALMRHPADWLRSWYRFFLRDDLDDYAHGLRDRGFDAFARDYISGHPALAAVGTQRDFLCENGRPLPDRIFPYEDMGRLLAFLEDRLDCAIELPRINVPPAVDVGLSRETEADLERFMADDFGLYEDIMKGR